LLSLVQGEGGESSMALRALLLITTLSSVAAFLAEWGYGP
jgi:hypothetical protein